MCYIPTQCLCCFCRFSWVLKVIYVTDPICNSAWDIGQSRQVRVSRKYIYTDTVFMRVIERISFNTLVESIRVCKLIWHCASVSARDDDTFRRIKELKLICVYILLSLSNCNTFYTGWSKKRVHRPSYLIANIPKTPWPNCRKIGGLLQYYMLKTVINFLFLKISSRCGAT